MRLHALLNLYDEDPPLVVRCLTSVRERLAVEHLVVVDGRYEMYAPGSPAASSAAQVGTAVLAARELGMACTLHTPTEPWASEAVKRTGLFALAWALAEPGDWFLILDADYTVLEAPADLRDRLEATDLQVADVRMHDASAPKGHPAWNEYHTTRPLFRAQPIRLRHNHFTYFDERGEALWAGGDEAVEVEGLDLRDCLVIEHDPHGSRSPERRAAKHRYYVEREESGVELGPCACGRQATHKLPTRWRMAEAGPVVAALTEACDRCARRIERANGRDLKALGIDPRSVVVGQRYGEAPR